MSAVDKFTGDTPDGAIVIVEWIEDYANLPEGDRLALPGWLNISVRDDPEDPEPAEMAVHPAIARLIVQGIAAVIR